MGDEIDKGNNQSSTQDDSGKNASQSSTQTDLNTLASCEVTSKDIEGLNNAFAPKIWLEVLPSQMGTVLAAILADIMTEGLTPVQENILGNFIAAVGTLISYKASRDDLASSTNS
jgi:hypothetical protein